MVLIDRDVAETRDATHLEFNVRREIVVVNEQHVRKIAHVHQVATYESATTTASRQAPNQTSLR